jgi:hypothetical protein
MFPILQCHLIVAWFLVRFSYEMKRILEMPVLWGFHGVRKQCAASFILKEKMFPCTFPMPQNLIMFFLPFYPRSVALQQHSWLSIFFNRGSVCAAIHTIGEIEVTGGRRVPYELYGYMNIHLYTRRVFHPQD